MLTPRFAEDDFTRNRQDALDYVTKTLRGNADEELGKQAMATVLYNGQPYGYPTQGTVAGLNAITLEDVKKFYASHFARDRLVVGVARRLSRRLRRGVREALRGAAGQGAAAAEAAAPARAQDEPAARSSRRTRAPTRSRSAGRSTITRKDPDFYPLTVARSYLGEHRTFNGVLMNHLREMRGLNYGDYAYVENFIQDGWSTFPLPNIARRQQHFELWLRPVPPQNSLFALRAALYETDKLIREGIPQAGFEATRTFLAELLEPVGAGRRRGASASPSTPWSRARTWSRSCRRGCPR